MAALSDARTRNAPFPPARRRLALLAIAGIACSIGIVALVSLGEAAWMVDVRRNLGAARDLLAGDFGRDGGYLYSPFAALALIPLTWLPEPVAIAAWIGCGVTILCAGVARTTRALPLGDRILIGLTALSFLPVLYDLLLGNVTVALLAGIALVAWRPAHARNGIPLGLLLAAAPKPGLIPVMLWMVLFRRRSLAGVVTGSLIATTTTIALFGIGPYLAWIAVLRAPDYLSSPMAGNMALSSLPMPWSLITSTVAILAAIWTIRRGPWPALLGSVCVGLLVAPYTLAYSGALILVVAPALATASPLLALAIALTASTASVVAFPIWVATLLGLAAAAPSRLWPTMPPDWSPEA